MLVDRVARCVRNRDPHRSKRGILSVFFYRDRAFCGVVRCAVCALENPIRAFVVRHSRGGSGGLKAVRGDP